MQMTHQEARQLIQFQADRTLTPHDKNQLDEHLTSCSECRSFAGDIKRLENTLVPLMNRHWNLRPTPLSIASLIAKRNSRRQTSILLTTRTAIISLAFVAFVLGFWQFSQPGKPASTSGPLSVLPAPTPSGQSTSTKISLPGCEEIVYQVLPGDTLDRLSAHFSVPKVTLMSINHLQKEALTAYMELRIPACTTPTGTSHPSTLTTTFTPLIRSTLSTPGGS